MTPEKFVTAWPLSRLMMHHTENGWQVRAFAFSNESAALSDALCALNVQLQERTISALPPVPSGWCYVFEEASGIWCPKKAQADRLPPPFAVVRHWLEPTLFLYIPKGPRQTPALVRVVFGPWHQQRENAVGLIETRTRMNLTTGAVGAVIQRWRQKERGEWVEYSGWVIFLGDPLTGAPPDASGHCAYADDIAMVDAAARALGVDLEDAQMLKAAP